ncbi:MAG: class I SAM-dependent methyltransferase [Acetobacteraceae bacterium]|nr:class I SAM-dependent methyltransferase [Acetobacteraceae bacterium]
MSAVAIDYIFDSTNECHRLERQAAIINLPHLLQHVPAVPDGGRILDAGCGSGAMARLLASHNPAVEVVGIDLNPSYVAFARERAAADTLANLSFEVGDLQSLPFPDTSFDFIWSQFVLYFVPSPDLAIREFRRVLRPEGAVAVSLHEGTFTTNNPVDADLQGRIESVIFGLVNAQLARRTAPMLHAAGFEGITVAIEADPIYTAIGAIAPDQRRNMEELFRPIMPRIATLLGGPAEADRFLSDLLAYYDRPDTCSYSLLWTIKGMVPRGEASLTV